MHPSKKGANKAIPRFALLFTRLSQETLRKRSSAGEYVMNWGKYGRKQTHFGTLCRTSAVLFLDSFSTISENVDATSLHVHPTPSSGLVLESFSC